MSIKIYIFAVWMRLIKLPTTISSNFFTELPGRAFRLRGGAAQRI